ncbi:MAG: hypothetical protein LBB39_00370 [Mycoplasmataceae bacterium]|nr:hypothetical protein [Mycoplasmataceae bacterium]
MGKLKNYIAGKRKLLFVINQYSTTSTRSEGSLAGGRDLNYLPTLSLVFSKNESVVDTNVQDMVDKFYQQFEDDKLMTEINEDNDKEIYIDENKDKLILRTKNSNLRLLTIGMKNRYNCEFNGAILDFNKETYRYSLFEPEIDLSDDKKNRYYLYTCLINFVVHKKDFIAFPDSQNLSELIPNIVIVSVNNEQEFIEKYFAYYTIEYFLNLDCLFEETKNQISEFARNINNKKKTEIINKMKTMAKNYVFQHILGIKEIVKKLNNHWKKRETTDIYFSYDDYNKCIQGDPAVNFKKHHKEIKNND